MQEKPDANLAQLNSDTEPSSTGLWPSTLQYLLPHLPFGSTQPRPSAAPSPSATQSSSPTSTECAPDNAPASASQTPAADSASEPATSSSNGKSFTPFEAVRGSIDNGTAIPSPPGTTALPFADPAQADKDSSSTPGSRSGFQAGLSQQESILADSSSRWLEDRGQPVLEDEEVGSSGREGEGKDEAPRMLFFWRSKRSKQPKPEPEIRPLQVQLRTCSTMRFPVPAGSSLLMC